MHDPPRIVGLGEILWDILPDGNRHLGGAPMNAAVHARALGCAASVISAVGNDELGREAIELLTQRHRLDASAVAILPSRPTGAVDVQLKSGQPTYEFRAGVAWEFLAVTAAARQAAQSAEAIIFGTLAQRSPVSRSAIHELLAMARPNCRRAFDVNLRPPFYDNSVIRGSLGLADLLKLNEEELPVVLAAVGVATGRDWAAQLFMNIPQLNVIALTRGDNGSTLFTRDRLDGHALPARRVSVQDTVGAGDAFTAALVGGLLRGKALETIHEQAVAAAAFVCSQSGATPALPASMVEAAIRG